MPIKQLVLPRNIPFVGDFIEKQISIPTAGGAQIIIALRTDSDHLSKFFSLNWPVNNLSEKPTATITALKGSAESYGLSEEFNGSRWFCPETKQVWMFGNEFYGNIKITVRGLCSELAPNEEMFLHGCSMTIDGRGVVLSGVSDAGKTTLTVALRKILGPRAQVVNDDWGPFSLDEGWLQFTGEPYLHMKYPSVHALLPNLEINPSSHPSENFYGNIDDPHSRLLITPQQVFGGDGLQSRAKLRLFVVVIRDHDMPTGISHLSLQDMPLLEQGKYSSFYDKTELFLNGSLFITDKTRQDRERNRHQVLIKNFPCVLANNVVAPEKTAEQILIELERTAPLKN